MSFHITDLEFSEHAKLKIVKVITIIDTSKMEMIKRRAEKGRWVRVK